MAPVFYMFEFVTLYPGFRLKYEYSKVIGYNTISEIQFDTVFKMNSNILARKLQLDMDSVLACIRSHYTTLVWNVKTAQGNYIIKSGLKKTDEHFRRIILVHAHSFNADLERILCKVRHTQPFVRSKTFRKHVISTLANIELFFSLVILATTAIVFYFSITTQYDMWAFLDMKAVFFRFVDKVHFIVFHTFTLISLLILCWFAGISMLIALELYVWSKEVLESIELNLVIFDKLGGSDADASSPSQINFCNNLCQTFKQRM